MPKDKKQNMPIWSFALGILSFGFLYYLLAPIALLIGYAHIKKKTGNGEGIALAGIIIASTSFIVQASYNTYYFCSDFDYSTDIDGVVKLVAAVIFFVLFPLFKGHFHRNCSTRKAITQEDESLITAFYELTDQGQRDELSRRFCDVEYKKRSSNKKNDGKQRIHGYNDLTLEEIEFIIEALYGEQKDFMRDCLKTYAHKIESLNLLPPAKGVWENDPESW